MAPIQWAFLDGLDELGPVQHQSECQCNTFGRRTCVGATSSGGTRPLALRDGPQGQQFNYAPFALNSTDEIRLVKIRPGTGCPVRCEISVHQRRSSSVVSFWPFSIAQSHIERANYLRPSNTRSDCRNYVCLSYQWHRSTDPDRTETIELNGQSLHVRPNLLEFLVTARKKLHSTFLWIDAICIDQSNLTERNEQVKKMGAIYEAAACVIVWLSSSEISESDLLRIRKLHQRNPLGWPYSRSLPTMEELYIVSEAHNLEYWTRAWINQEVSLASNCLVWLHCVHNQSLHSSATQIFTRPMTLRRFEQLYREYVRYLRAPTTDALTLLDMRQSVATQRSKPLRDMIEQRKTARCMEPADRIYALRSLCLEGDDIEVRYDSTRWDLLCRVVWACRENFCLCLVCHLLDALNLREELLANWQTHVEVPHTTPASSAYVSVTTARPLTLVHGPGIPLARYNSKDLDLTFQRYVRSSTLKTCDCVHAVSRQWKFRRGISVCAKLLCQGYAFQDIHIFCEPRQGAYQATGVRFGQHEEYCDGGLDEIFLNPRLDRGHRMTITLTIRGLLWLMSCLAPDAHAKHPTKRQRPAQYEILYEHTWDTPSKPVGSQHAPPRVSQSPQRQDPGWLFEKLDVKENKPLNFHHLVSQLTIKDGLERVRRTQSSLPGATRHDRRTHAIHQPRSRSLRKTYTGSKYLTGKSKNQDRK